MTTVLKASPRRFVSTPAIERVAARALRYLQSGFSVHLRGPAGTGKTTLALHLADAIGRPIMLMFGDDEFKTSDLIGNQAGYTRKKVVDNFIHSVVKVEDELRQNWVDSRLTLACKEGFTLVYDEFNRSRPEVNNVLLSALEEKLLVLPPSNGRSEYIRVNPDFRAIFTSNPEEYCGVHATQDALLDRLVTIPMPEPDELTQQEIAAQKTGIDRESARIIVRLVKGFRDRTQNEKTSGLRSCLIIARICHEHGIVATPENADFREICQDVLLSRSGLPLPEATRRLWEAFNEQICNGTTDEGSVASQRLTSEPVSAVTSESELYAYQIASATSAEPHLAEPHLAEPHLAKPHLAEPENIALKASNLESPALEAVAEPPAISPADAIDLYAEVELVDTISSENLTISSLESLASTEAEVYAFLQRHPNARYGDIESALGISRFQTVNAMQALTEKGLMPAEKPTYRSREGKRG